MAQARNGLVTPLPSMAEHRQAAPGAGRDALELQADVLSLIDETLIRKESVDNSRAVTAATRTEDRLAARLRRSVMFADVTRP